MKLKPCPFCGSEAKTVTILGRFGIKCPECFVSMRAGMYEEDASIIKAWNKRPEQNKKLVEAVKDLIGKSILPLQAQSKYEADVIRAFMNQKNKVLSIISKIEGE